MGVAPEREEDARDAEAREAAREEEHVHLQQRERDRLEEDVGRRQQMERVLNVLDLSSEVLRAGAAAERGRVGVLC